MYSCPQCGTFFEPPAEQPKREFRCMLCGYTGAIPPPIVPPTGPSAVSPNALSERVSGPPPILTPPAQKTDEDQIMPLEFARNKAIETDMDMTPMVDVVFLLLIFFMITAAFGLQKSIEVPAPESDQSSQQTFMPKDQEKTAEDIVVNITKEDRIFVEGEETTTQQELYAKLREHQYQGSQRRAKHLLIQAESEATHEIVVRVLDAASGVSMESVRLLTTD